MTADPGAVGARDGFERMGGFPNFSSGGAVYRFSRRIGRGGMGEIYLGLQEGIGGLERLVVVKRIYAQLGEDERFSRLLVQEARLAATIQHPNVVQILDLGRDANGYFLVMEYLSGESAVYVSRALRDRGERVPPAIACRLAADVAAGLHCAHTATDAAGQPQPIVHRDVTPSNLVLCYNGAVKVVNFGVARANLPEGQTGAGIKGKLSYLAPEQIDNRPLDGRTDVFQLGICLHEMLTGQRLFRGENDHARVAAVLERPIPAPSEIVPSLPDSVDKVVLWALERDPARRPESAEHFRLALEEALARNGMVGPHDLAAWMKVTFAERLAQRTQFERRCVAEMRARRSSDRLPSIDDAGVTPPPDPTGALHFVYDAMGAGRRGRAGRGRRPLRHRQREHPGHCADRAAPGLDRARPGRLRAAPCHQQRDRVARRWRRGRRAPGGATGGRPACAPAARRGAGAGVVTFVRRRRRGGAGARGHRDRRHRGRAADRTG